MLLVIELNSEWITSSTYRADIRSYSCVSLSCLMALPSIAPEICGFVYRRCTI
ncbi:hypothetical protein T06_11883 [Trichinella sp. T6]|nr:hypothetical protein T06_11883 [Trichinella sp. T6]